jgi:hypothetical protein
VGKALTLTAALTLFCSFSACAVNWEGHENFFHEAEPLPQLTEGVPPPKVKPKPLCADRRKHATQNPYEQEAIPGVNCVEGAKSKP